MFTLKCVDQHCKQHVYSARGGSHKTISVSIKVTEIMTCPISWLTCPISGLKCTSNPRKSTSPVRYGAKKCYSMNIAMD